MRKPAKQRPNKISSKKSVAVIPPSPLTGEVLSPGRGRPKGSENKQTRQVKDALLLAASAEGDITPKRNTDGSLVIDEETGAVVLLNGKPGQDELVGYMRYLARNHPVTFAHMLARFIPHQLKLEEQNAPPPTQRFTDEDDIVTFLRKQGSTQQVAQIVAQHMLEAKQLYETDKKRQH